MAGERSMRAVRLHGDLSVRIDEIPWPVPGPGDAIVRMAACGLCGSDVHFLEGMPVPAGLPITLGHEPAGVVEAVGAEVRDFAPGDRVAMHLGGGCGRCRVCSAGHPNCCPTLVAPGLHIDGALADAVRVPADSLVRVPEGVSLAAAAVATDCVATPYHALACRARLRRGERVAVIGVGGVGGQAVRMARLLGAEQVVAVDLSAAALERATCSGASEAIRVASGESPAGAIREATGGGADVVVECVGDADLVAAAVNAVRPGGRVLVVGVGMSPPRIELPQALFALTELSVIGSFGSHKEDLEEIYRLQAAGSIDIESCISHRLPLDRAAEGLEMLRSHRGDPQRIVVEMSGA